MKMTILRQMPSLHLRGSLVNQTMKNLTLEEKKTVEKLLEKITKHPDLAPHRAEFANTLSHTIRGDYYDDIKAADQEFQISIFRGVVELLYHRKYSYKCNSCQSSTYITQRGKPTPINRQTDHCPNCNKIEIENPGDTDWKVGEYVDRGEFQASYANFTDLDKSPKAKSPILVIPGEKKYSKPQKILNDDKQLQRFFKEFIWNYHRQILNENKRKKHKQKPTEIKGPADLIIIEEILATIEKLKIECLFDNNENPVDGWYIIRAPLLKTPPEFSISLQEIVNKSKNYGIHIKTTRNEIWIKATSDAPIIKATISKPEYVKFQDGKTSDDDSTDAISQISKTLTGGVTMYPEHHVAIIDGQDQLEKIRKSLPDGNCQKVFDIYAGRGEVYNEFSQPKAPKEGVNENEEVYGFGDGEPKISHIARFLDIQPRAVKKYREHIKIVMIAFGFTPGLD
jgi:hypothetical protein